MAARIGGRSQEGSTAGQVRQEVSAIKPTDKESIFDELVEGLEASIQYSKGALSLRSVTLPAPPP